MNLRIFESSSDLADAAAAEIARRATSGAVIALSGGSTPGPVYERLGNNSAVRAAAVTWVEVDERYVPLADPRSNASMIERTLFGAGRPESHRFLRFETELDDPAATAKAFDAEWQRLGIAGLDVIVLGVGDDGHTASLFPGTPALEASGTVSTSVFVEKLDMWRVTLTLPVIRGAKLRIVLAEGAGKRAILQSIRAGQDHPIGRATEGDIETWWFVDRAAAGE